MARLSALFSYRFEVRFPNKKNIVIYPEGKSTEILLSYLDESTTQVFSPFGNRLNLFILIRMLISGRISRFDYLVSHLKLVRPKLVITTSDNDINFYRLKSLLPNIKTIAIQNGVRGNASTEPNESFFDLLAAASDEGLSADFVCTFGDALQSEYKKNIKCETISIGNLRNNYFNADEIQQEKNLLVYVSGLSAYPEDTSKTFYYFRKKPVSYKDFYAAELQLCRFLIDYCEHSGLHFVICGKRKSTELEEKKFFENGLGDMTPHIYSRDETFSSYELLCKAQYVITLDSTIAYEFLARGKRVAIVGARLNGLLPDDLISTSGFTFGFPAPVAKSGQFWSSTLTQLEVGRVLDNIRNATDEEWAETISSFTDSLMTFDPDNSRLRRLIEEVSK